MIRVRGWLRPAYGGGVSLVVTCPRCGACHAWPWDGGLRGAKAVDAGCGAALIVTPDPRLEAHHKAHAGARLGGPATREGSI